MVLILSFWAIKPFLIPGFFPMHDDTQVARVFEMGKALKDGMFPVRWVQDLGYGYGYPIFNFYAPLAYYFGGFINLLGFDALVATKTMMIVGILLSGIFMYLLAKEFWGEVGGVVSGLFYLYAPYHALDIYVRGDVAEFWAYSFIPLGFYGLCKVYKERKWKWVVVGSLGYAGVVLSHNLTAMMVTPFLLIVALLYCYIAYKRKKFFIIYHLLFIISFGLLVSSFYWIPAIFEMKYTNVIFQIGGGADFRDHFVCIQQLWESSWGFGGSAPGCIDGLSFKIGKLHLISVFIAFILLILPKSIFGKIMFYHYNDTYHYSGKHPIVILAILGFIFSVFFTLSVSRPIWEVIPQMAFFQYPWRFLIFASFFSSFLAGGLMWLLHKIYYSNTALYQSSILLIILLLYGKSKLFMPQTVFSKTSVDYTNDISLKWTTSKISDEYMPVNFVKPASMSEIANNKISILEGESNIISQSNKTYKIKTLIDVKKETNLKINIAYFPAWNAFLDSKKVPYTASNNGLIIVLPEGRHSLDIEFIQTPIEKIANSISLISLIVLFTSIIFTRKFHYE